MTTFGRFVAILLVLLIALAALGLSGHLSSVLG